MHTGMSKCRPYIQLLQAIPDEIGHYSRNSIKIN